VIEGRATPAVRRMASPTIRAELSVMGIFVCMTGVTGAGRPLVNAIYMAGFAFSIFMLSCQRETRVAVVEGCPTPTVRGMTCPTILTELSVMGIIRCMAGVTIRRRTLENTVLVTR
jgi:hypothetical protein